MTPDPPLFLDGVPDEVIPGPRGRRRALGSDPFEDSARPDPFCELLEALPPVAARSRRVPAVRVAAAPRPGPVAPAAPEPARRPGRRPAVGTRVPRLSELEDPPAEGLLGPLLAPEHRRRLTALAHLVEGGAPYDRFGFSPDVTRRAFPIVHALYRAWFRVRSEGVEHLPAEGAAILAANHAGLLPFDGAMAVLDVVLRTDPPRLPRAVVDRWAGSLPFVNVLFARLGQVVGTRENFADLLDDGQLVLVFPEGMAGVLKRVTQRYRVQSFRTGFVELALERRVPIVPMAIVGSDDQAPILFDLQPVARALGLPALPITPTFPWLGPLGLMPLPVRYRIVYGEPMEFHRQFGPEGANDPRLVRYLSRQVRRRVQQLLDRGRG